jgi:cell division protease FtsH
LIDDAFQAARRILEQNRTFLDAGARELLEMETLGPEQLAKLTAGLERVDGRKSEVKSETISRDRAQ